MGKYVAFYCSNNNRELIRVSNPLLKRIGGLSPSDYDDFYSIAAMTVWDCEKRFEDNRDVPFEPFLVGCLKRKFMTEMTARTRDKRIMKAEIEDEETGAHRRVPVLDIRLDAPIGEDDFTWKDILADQTDVEKEIIEEEREEYSPKMVSYLGRLSEIQREVLKRIAAGYSPLEIMEELHINSSDYTECNAAIHSYKNVSVLF